MTSIDKNSKKHTHQNRNKKRIQDENPYRPFDLEIGDWFCQQKLIQQIKEILHQEKEKNIILLKGNPGSGKSSTLRWMTKSPKVISREYIPLYLDTRKYISFEADELLFSIYRDIAEQLNEMGYSIAKPGYYEKRKDQGPGTLLLLIEGAIESDKKILVILDEFDSFLEKIDKKKVSIILEKFSRMNWDWYRYALIFAGDNRICEMDRLESFQKLTARMERLSVEEFLDADEFKRLIAEPVSGRIEYTQDAIAEIAWLSGNNVYLQQLICYYIFQDPTVRNKKKCTKKDVERNSEKLLLDERPAFKFAWRNHISTNCRLIASALADLSLTELKGDYFYLKESHFLDLLFEYNLSKEIAELQGFGYFTRMDGRRFFKCPFQSPLYGRWVRKRHPFVNTIFDNIDDIAPRINLKSLSSFLKEIHDKKSLHALHNNINSILDTASKWLELFETISNNNKISQESSESFEKMFFKSFSKLLKLEVTEKTHANTRYFAIDIKNLNIGIVDEVFCFVQNKAKLTANDISHIETIAGLLAQETQTKLTIFLYSQKSEMVEDLVKKTYLNFITIDEIDLVRLLFSNHPSAYFRNIVLSKLSLAKISPYGTSGPAKTIFYGRKNYIDRINRNTHSSYAIVGARQIGKSSLLMRIKENASPQKQYIYLDMEAVFGRDIHGEFKKKNYKAFLKTMQDKTAQTLKKDISFSTILGRYTFERMIQVLEKISSENIQLVYLIDEVDILIEFDRSNNDKLLSILRNLAQSRICQFVFAGFKELYHRKRNIENPLYNFCDEFLLDPLEKQAALELITKPMQSIGVIYKNPDDRELILEYTANHPSLLQFFCKSLLDQIENHDQVTDRRVITREDIEKVFDRVYEKHIMETVYMFNSDLSLVNRMILMLLVEDTSGLKQFSARKICNKLKACGVDISISDVHKHLRNLVMRFILADRGKDKYEISLPVFPDILKRWLGEEFDDYKTDTISEILKNENRSL